MKTKSKHHFRQSQAYQPDHTSMGITPGTLNKLLASHKSGICPLQGSPRVTPRVTQPASVKPGAVLTPVAFHIGQQLILLHPRLCFSVPS